MAIIAVDFDNTLVDSEDGDVFPVPGAAESLRRLRQEGHRIIIHTCRTGIASAQGELSDEIKFIEQCLQKFGMEYDEIYIGEKLVAHIYIDDRAVAFEGDWRETLQKTMAKSRLWHRKAG
jgi:hypothetical protein